MKKRLLYSLCILLFSSSIYAQTSIGVIAGLNMSKLTGDVEANTKYKSNTGINIGAFIDIPISNSLILSMQPSYSQEGTKITEKQDGEYYPVEKSKIKLNYFSLPILLKVNTPSERFYAIGGVEPAKYLSSSLTPTGEESQDLNVEINDWNFAIHFGAGMRFPIGKSILFVEARYAQGINNITDDPIINEEIPRVKTSSFKLLTGIEIPLNFKKNK